jgi:tetratricopeptide (TPR) repeat protein
VTDAGIAACDARASKHEAARQWPEAIAVLTQLRTIFEILIRTGKRTPTGLPLDGTGPTLAAASSPAAAAPAPAVVGNDSKSAVSADSKSADVKSAGGAGGGAFTPVASASLSTVALGPYPSALRRLAMAYRSAHQPRKTLELFNLMVAVERSTAPPAGAASSAAAVPTDVRIAADAVAAAPAAAAAAAKRSIDSVRAEAAALENAGLLHEELREYDRALACHDAVLALATAPLATGGLADPSRVAEAHLNRAMVFRAQKFWRKACEAVDAAIAIRTAQKDQIGNAQSTHWLLTCLLVLIERGFTVCACAL